MACPTIPYGIPADGATEYSLQSGRELFRCGRDCIKMFITNVMIENTSIQFTCDEINDASQVPEVCLQSINGNWKDRMVINWIAKEDADSSMDSGVVINRVSDCSSGSGEGTGKIYTHTEGTVGVKAQFNINMWKSNAQTAADAIIAFAIEKLDNLTVNGAGVGGNFASFQRILSDISTNVSQTDWQGGGCNYQLFLTRTLDAQNENGFRANFNFQNGQAEIGKSCTVYDDTSAPLPLATIISTLLGETCSFEDMV